MKDKIKKFLNRLCFCKCGCIEIEPVENSDNFKIKFTCSICGKIRYF